MAYGVYWLGADGNYYVKDDAINGGQVFKADTTNQAVVDLMNGMTKIDDPNPPQETAPTTTQYAGGDTLSAADRAAAEKAAQEAAERALLKGQIAAKAPEVEQAYGGLFGDLENLLKARDAQLETQYGDQFKKAGEQYAAAIPQIETSYASIGAGDSTDNTYAKVGAKKGFEDTTKTIGTNKEADKGKLGQYGIENRAKFTADKEAANRNIARAGETTDIDALRGLRNDLETNVSTAGVTRATLTPEGTAAQDLSRQTADSGRYQAAVDALDSIIKSSLAGSVKQAAVKAVSENAGLSDEEKKKIDQTYGNVYAEQAAL